MITIIYSYDSNNHSSRQQFNAKIEKNSSSPQKQHDNDDPHMKSTPQFSLQRFSFILTNIMINTILHNSNTFFPTLTSFEKRKYALFIGAHAGLKDRLHMMES